jgi:hypothetical protein
MSTYYGWPSHESWLTYTWLSNDALVHETCSLLAKSASTLTDAADALEEFVEEQLCTLEEANLASDLLRASLGHVDWCRLAEHFAQS